MCGGEGAAVGTKVDGDCGDCIGGTGTVIVGWIVVVIVAAIGWTTCGYTPSGGEIVWDWIICWYCVILIVVVIVVVVTTG